MYSWLAMVSVFPKSTVLAQLRRSNHDLFFKENTNTITKNGGINKGEKKYGRGNFLFIKSQFPCQFKLSLFGLDNLV